MATNHTTNYQLNLWEPSDTFLRTEFNENSQKLDAALKAEADARSALAQTVAGKADASALNSKADASAVTALSQTVSGLIQPAPLLDFTLAAKTDLITIPITDEYRQKYRRLLLYFDLQINGEKSADILVRDTSGELANFYTLLHPYISSGVFDQTAFSEVILELTAPVVLFYIYSHRKYRRTEQGDFYPDVADHHSTIPNLTWSQVSQLELKPRSDTKFLAGGQVRMFGLL